MSRSFSLFPTACSGSVRNWLPKLAASGPVSSVFDTAWFHSCLPLPRCVFDLQPVTVKDSISGRVLLLTRYFNGELFKSPTEKGEVCRGSVCLLLRKIEPPSFPFFFFLFEKKIILERLKGKKKTTILQRFWFFNHDMKSTWKS